MSVDYGHVKVEEVHFQERDGCLPNQCALGSLVCFIDQTYTKISCRCLSSEIEIFVSAQGEQTENNQV